jgi:hypothetical protein
MRTWGLHSSKHTCVDAGITYAGSIQTVPILQAEAGVSTPWQGFALGMQVFLHG